VTDENLGNVKGRAIRDFLGWYLKEHGMARIKSAFEMLDPADRAFFRLDQPTLGIAAATWYPARTIHRALDALTHGLGADDIDQLADRGGQATVRAMMRGAQGIVFALLASPKRWGFFVGKFWPLNYDSGKANYEMLGTNADVTLITEWRSHHPLLCRLNTAVKVTIYESIGCRNTTIDRRFCVDRGDSGCGSRLHWEDG